MTDRLDELRESPSPGSAIRLALSDELRALLNADESGDTLGTVGLTQLYEYIAGRPGTGAAADRTSCLAVTEAAAEAERILACIEESEGGAARHDVPPSAAGPSGDGERDHTVGDAADDLVSDQVARQMGTVGPPEGPLLFNVPQRSDQATRNEAVETFELRDGPSDVTAYHDFRTLQIAFPHVWTEVFDGRLRQLGEELYQEYVKLNGFSGVDVDDATISTLDDLIALMERIRGLGRTVQDDLPTDLRSSPAVPEGTIFDFFGLGDLARRLFDPGGATQAEPQAAQSDVPAIDPTSRLHRLLSRLDKMLAEPYAFDVFARDSVNFGFIATYRQTWTPQNYQVGDLVSTVPLAPKEIRRYTTRRVAKKSRAVKELEDNLTSRRTDAADTSRVSSEIVDRAHEKSNFNLTAREALGGEGFTVESTQSAGGEQGKQSERVKREFRESVLKSAQEYKEQHRIEVETSDSSEQEETAFHEIQNPNDELTVTYLFYELQRTYRISERLHGLTPVVLVANEVPAPHEIDDAWLVQHDWILRRVVLDDSFRPALSYLTESFVGAEAKIRILEDTAVAQKKLVETLRQQLRTQDQILAANERDVLAAAQNLASSTRQEGLLDGILKIFDPLGITGDSDTGAVDAAETIVDYAKETRDRADRERARLTSQLEVAVSALQAAVDRLTAAVTEHYDKVAQIDRLRMHVKNNILYYMQAVWDLEPPDQRFFRLYNIDVPVVTAHTEDRRVTLRRDRGALGALLGHDTALVHLPVPEVTVSTKKLVEVADLDTVLAYRGNYSVFALKENNYFTLRMMQDYLEVGDDLRICDPDEANTYTVDELRERAACLHRTDEEAFGRHREQIKQLLVERLASARKDDDLVVVPTASLYIEALVGTHPLLEDFKLIHRALDVKRVQSDVRRTELENIRLAARSLRGNDEDPDVDRKIVVEGVAAPVTIQTDTA
ncbi:hypothetical protein [Streptomyces sp. NPDC002884]|uniref:hypothetical protein n=1 Tax=Streptomyces sp. NPDC002884 TaxID=3154544 RepID=UPI00332EB39C